MLNIIVAPHNIDAKAEKITKKIVRYLKQQNEEYSVYFSLDMDCIATNVNELLSLGETEFVVVGDDSVIHKLINSIKDMSKIKLGIIPTSNNDDFASYINLNSKPVEALKVILNRKIHQCDLLLVNNLRVLNNVVIGASADILDKYNQHKIKNAITEQLAIFQHQKNFKGVELSLSSKNGKSKTDIFYEIIIANGGKNKGKVISPLSNIEDGLFNLNYVLYENRKQGKKYLKAFSKGKHIYLDETKQQWLNNLKIISPNNKIKAVVDGNVLSLDSLDVQIVEKGLKIYR